MALTTVSNLVTNITQLLESEVNFLLGVDQQVRSLSIELQHMDNFLKNSEGKRKNHANLKVLVDQIRDVAYEAEDIVDEYVYNVAKEKRKNKAVKFFRGYNRAAMLHNVGDQMKQLKEVIEDIYKQKGKYGIKEEEGGIANEAALRILHELDMQKWRQDVKEDDVIGFIEEAESLVNQLVKGTYDLDVISISRMGGLGKTTLAKKVYKDHFVRDRFRCRAWVSVSQKFNLKQLLQEILEGITQMGGDEIEGMKEEELKQELKKQLSNHRYLVLDDLWSPKHWDDITKVFPNDNNGSRIFVTTRISEVARHVGTCSPRRFPRKELPYRPRASREKDSCQMSRFAISNSGFSRYSSKEKLQYISKAADPTLWIAEGFIQPEDNGRLTKEVVARSYLQELINRSLIQVEKRSSDGGVKTCRVHDLTRDLFLTLSREEKFLDSHSSIPSEQTKTRQLSIHCSRQNYILSTSSSKLCRVRTPLCFKEDNQNFSEEHWEALFKCYGLLRVYLGEGEVHRLPKEIESLILLKYLRIRTNEVAGVPASIFALHNLQTLDLRRSRINVLPDEIWRMHQLRHLFIDGPSRLPKKRSINGCLSNLQTLCYISHDPTQLVKISEMAPNLRNLGLYNYRCSSLDEEKSTFKLPYLESLKFARQCTFDDPIKLPPSINKITIKTSFLPPETIEVFQNQSNLRILKLGGATFDDYELVFEKGSFQGLQLLKIENSSMVSLKLKQGAAPNLKRVIISKCPSLEMIPKEQWEMPNVQKLELLWLPKKFTNATDKTKINGKLEVVIYPGVGSFRNPEV